MFNYEHLLCFAYYWSPHFSKQEHFGKHRFCNVLSFVYNTFSSSITLLIVIWTELSISMSSHMLLAIFIACCNFSPSAFKIWESAVSWRAIDSIKSQILWLIQGIQQWFECWQLHLFVSWHLSDCSQSLQGHISILIIQWSKHGWHEHWVANIISSRFWESEVWFKIKSLILYSWGIQYFFMQHLSVVERHKYCFPLDWIIEIWNGGKIVNWQ